MSPEQVVAHPDLTMHYVDAEVEVFTIFREGGFYHYFDLDELLPLMLRRGLVTARPPGISGEQTDSSGVEWLAFYHSHAFPPTPRCLASPRGFCYKARVLAEACQCEGRVYITTHFLKGVMLWLAFKSTAQVAALKQQVQELDDASEEIMATEPAAKSREKQAAKRKRR